MSKIKKEIEISDVWNSKGGFACWKCDMLETSPRVAAMRGIEPNHICEKGSK